MCSGLSLGGLMRLRRPNVQRPLARRSHLPLGGLMYGDLSLGGLPSGGLSFGGLISSGPSFGVRLSNWDGASN